MATADTHQANARQTRFYDVPFDTWFGLVRHVTVGGFAGLAAGFLIGGVGGRIFMRIAGAAAGTRGAGRITEAGFTVGEVTPIGTFFLVLFIGGISGIVGAGMYLAIRPWLGWAGRFRGTVFGVVLFALTSATSDIMNPDNRDFTILRNGPLLVALIVGLFVAFGVVADLMFKWFDARLEPKDEGSTSAGVLYGVIAGLGALVVVPGVAGILLGGENVCDCESPMLASWSFVVVCVSTIVVWVGAVKRLPSWARSVAAATGYVGLAGVVAFGLIRAISDATDIIG